MVQNVKDLRAKLNIEMLRDALDVIILEHREIKFGKAGTVQNIAAGIASKIEAS